jgi:hypothetical protein
MKISALFIIATLCLTYLSFLGYVVGYFVLVPAIRKKLGKTPAKDSFPWFDNFLYGESVLKELSEDTREPLVVSTRRLITVSEYSFVVNFLLFLILLSLS